MKLFTLLLAVVSAYNEYEVVMPTKKRHIKNYLLESLESFNGVSLHLFRQGEDFYDFDTSCSYKNIICHTFNVSVHTDLKYEKWRTEQNKMVLNVLNWFRFGDKDYVVWVEDDVLLLKSLDFVHDTREDIICLRYGYKYCGLTGYVFSRKFVEDLVVVLEKEMYDMPIDWIVDKTVHNYKYFRKRKSVIKHIGQFSSRNDKIITRFTD